MPSRSLWEAALLAASAIAALVFLALMPSRLPSDADYRAVAAALEKLAQPGDAVLLHPWWTERARLFAPASIPVVGYLTSDGDPLEEHRRVWVLSQPRLPYSARAAFDRAFLPDRRLLAGPFQFGTLDLFLYANGRFAPARFRATDGLAGVEAGVLDEAGRFEPCRPERAGLVCPRGIRVAPGWHELRYAPHRCLALEPPGGPARLVLRFPDLPAGKVRLEAGIVWEHAARHDPSLTPLVVGVQVPGARGPLASLRIPPGQEGMRHVTATEGGGALEVWVQSDRRDERQACVELLVLGGGDS